MYQALGGYSTGVKIVKFFLHETGSYNTQYRRPYNTHMEPDTIRSVLEQLGGSNKYNPSLLGGLSNKFITPSATYEKELTLANGWNERRLRFMLQVEYETAVGAKKTEIVLGYSNYNGVSASGHIDPRMEFYINSIMEVRNNVGYGAFGAQQRTAVLNSSHILIDNNWDGIYAQNRDQHMRPTDVYTAMTRVHLHGIPKDGIADARSMANSNAVKSRRSNAVASNYVSTIFDGYTKAVLESAHGDGAYSLMDAARGHAVEAAAAQDPFLSALMNIRQESSIGNTFTINNLIQIDPNVDNVTVITLLSPTTQAITHQAGQTANWHGSDLTTTTANILSQTIPGILMDLALTRIVFKTTNRDITSTIRTAVMDAQGFVSGDLSAQLSIFVSRIETEVLLDISFNNSIEFAIEMNVDLLGETWLKLSLDGGPAIDYVTPSFCDAILTPVVSCDDNRVINLASDLQILSEHLVDNHAMTKGMRRDGNEAFNSNYTAGIF